MKQLILLALMSMNSLVMAHTCHISLYDSSNKPFKNFYSQQDAECEEAANRCYQTIKNDKLNPQLYHCYTISMTVDKMMTPVVNEPKSDGRRTIESGETVIFDGKTWVVIDVPSKSTYNLIPEVSRDDDKILENVARQYLILTRGCEKNICTYDSMIDLTTTQYVAVIGIDYYGKFVTTNAEDDEMIFNVDASTLATTKGCAKARYGDVCIGSMVTDGYNRYRLVGIQPNGYVVLERNDIGRRLIKDMDLSRFLPEF